MLTSAAVSVAPVLIPIISARIDSILHDYTDDDIRTIERIQFQFRMHCTENERANHPSTLLDPGFQRLNTNNPEIPALLQMSSDPATRRQPLYYVKGLIPILNVDQLLSRNNLNPLHHYLKEMISYICQYQVTRRQGYSYDPITLLFEEFKCWLSKLVYCDITVNTDIILNIIKGRVEYLNELSGIGNEALYGKTIKRLYDFLVNIILPLIRVETERQSAREHFRNLKLHMSSVLTEATEFLFYIYRDSAAPKYFILNEVKNPTLREYVDTVSSTTSGKLLKFLLNSNSLELTFPSLKELEHNLVVRNHLDLVKNDFFNEKKDVILPKDQVFKLQLSSWYKDINNQRCGIHPDFQKPELMTCYLTLHALLKELSVLYCIYDLIYELAGDGGNLLVYGWAATKVKNTIHTQERLTNSIKYILEQLHKPAFNKKWMYDMSDKTKLLHLIEWRENFDCAYKAFNTCIKEIDESQIVISKIQEKIREINQKKYEGHFKSRYQLFSGLVDHFITPNLGNFIPAASNSLSIVSSINNRMDNNARWEDDTQWYTDDEMNRLLNHYVGQQQGIELLTAMLATDTNRGNDLRDNLVQFTTNRLIAISQGHQVNDKIIIPINLNENHWSLLYVILPKDAARLPSIYYFDPFGDPPPQEVVKAIQTVPMFQMAEIVNVGSRLQQDGFNCGPWVIEATRLIINKGIVPDRGQVDIIAARKEHRTIRGQEYPRESSQIPKLSPLELPSPASSNHTDALTTEQMGTMGSFNSRSEHAIQYYNKKEYEKALPTFLLLLNEPGLSKDNTIAIHLYCAHICTEANSIVAALDHYQKIMELDIYNRQARVERGKLLKNCGLFHDAKRDFCSVVDMVNPENPDNTEINQYIAQVSNEIMRKQMKQHP